VAETTNNCTYLSVQALHKRADMLAHAATQSKVRLMVDAEQTYFQPAINAVVINLQVWSFAALMSTLFLSGGEGVYQSWLMCSENTTRSSRLCSIHTSAT
jgi:hypothetical protein